MKLFEIHAFDDNDTATIMVVAENKESAENKVINMDCWSCLISVHAYEISEVNGYKVILEKI